MTERNNIPLLQVEGLAKQFYLHEQEKAIPSSQDVNFTACEGELTALVGPTGAGKSSVLKAIYRTYLPSAGRLLFRCDNGEVVDLASADEHTILQLRRDEIGFVTQFLHAPPRRITLDVVAQPLLLRGVSQKAAHDDAAELLSRLNVPERLWNLSPATFSGGEKQRVNLARGIIAKPRLLMLDEPTASLDPATSQQVVSLLNELKQQGIALLAIFHDPALVEALAENRVQLTPPTNTETYNEEVA